MENRLEIEHINEMLNNNLQKMKEITSEDEKMTLIKNEMDLKRKREKLINRKDT